MNRSAVFALAVMALAAPALASGYQITKTVPLGPPDHWDYLVFDPVMDRVYVSHAGTVTVVNGQSGEIVGTVEGIAGSTHGIVPLQALGKGYTDDSNAGVAVVFDLKSLKILKQIKAEPDADGMAYDAGTGHVLVIDGDSGKVTVIDPKTETVVATIDGGGGLEYGVSGGNGKFYVNGAERNEIVRMDLTTNKADAHWPMPACMRPHGLAIDRAHMRLFATCSNKVMTVMNAENGHVIANLPIGEGTDFAEFDSVRGLAFSSNRDGTLSIIQEKSPSEFVALPPVKTQYGARTMAVDPRTGRLYLVTADIAVNESAAPTDYRHRYTTKPGSVRLLFLDPTP
ncbi:MAG: YncE family protein [Alphaproteobacteria bacterium]|nr:YncE family protein [Alphaproteobacteria bacterium]